MRRTVVIVDDHEQFRRAARTLLELEGFDVVGEAGDGAAGLATVDRLRPELVLLDVNLPDANGFELVAAFGSTTNVVLVSSRDPANAVARTRRSGALGFIPKDELTGERLRTILKEAS